MATTQLLILDSEPSLQTQDHDISRLTYQEDNSHIGSPTIEDLSEPLLPSEPVIPVIPCLIYTSDAADE